MMGDAEKGDEASCADSGEHQNGNQNASPKCQFFGSSESPDLFFFFIYGVLNSRLSAGRPQGGGGTPRPIPICSGGRGAGVAVRVPAGDAPR